MVLAVAFLVGRQENKKVYAVNADEADKSHGLVLLHVGQTPNKISVLFLKEQTILCRCLSKSEGYI